MTSKEVLLNLRQREYNYLASQKDASDEYTKSLQRLMSIEERIFKMEEAEKDGERKQKLSKSERRSLIFTNIMEGIKTAGGIALPIIGLVWITATEREITFTGALREYTKYFLPRK